MSRIFWDTNLFIYLLEETGARHQRVLHLVDRMKERGDELCTSTLTLGEVLVKPTSLGRRDLAEKYEQLMNTPGVAIVDFDRECARIYAALRADKSIRPPDAIQLSCAAKARSDLFITNDDRLSRKTVAGVQFVVSLERAFL